MQESELLFLRIERLQRVSRRSPRVLAYQHAKSRTYCLAQTEALFVRILVEDKVYLVERSSHLKDTDQIVLLGRLCKSQSYCS